MRDKKKIAVAALVAFLAFAPPGTLIAIFLFLAWLFGDEWWAVGFLVAAAIAGAVVAICRRKSRRLVAGTLPSASERSSDEEQKFWTWFAANESRLFSFEREQEALFDELTRELHEVHPDLTFEFGPEEGGLREFIVSAGGLKGAFPAVISLVARAPHLPRWRVIAFRPRRNPLHDVSFGDVTIKAADVRCSSARGGGKVDVVLYLPGYSESQGATFRQIGYLLLDEVLGEYDVETGVGVIEFKPLVEADESESHPIADLRAIFDKHFQ